MRVAPFALFAALASGASSVARADGFTPSDRRDHSRVGATIGLFTPNGELSVEYAQAIYKYAEVSVGAGYGLWVRVGPQASIMPRLRMRFGSATLSVGTGISVGRFNNISAFSREDAPEIPTLWSNTEAALQLTTRGGLYVRGALGVGVQLAHGSYHPHDAEIDMTTDDHIPYGYLGVGMTL